MHSSLRARALAGLRNRRFPPPIHPITPYRDTRSQCPAKSRTRNHSAPCQAHRLLRSSVRDSTLALTDELAVAKSRCERRQFARAILGDFQISLCVISRFELMTVSTEASAAREPKASKRLANRATLLTDACRTAHPGKSLSGLVIIGSGPVSRRTTNLGTAPRF